MLTGRLYDRKTLNEIGNRPRTRLPLWWEEPAAEQAGNRVRHTRNGGTATLRDDEVWLSPFPRSYGSSTWLITLVTNSFLARVPGPTGRLPPSTGS